MAHLPDHDCIMITSRLLTEGAAEGGQRLARAAREPTARYKTGLLANERLNAIVGSSTRYGCITITV